MRTIPGVVLVAAAMCAASGPVVDARAAEPRQGTVHLVTTMSGAVLSDALSLSYSVTVRNLGPDTATNVFATNHALFCPSVSAPLSSCTNTAPTTVHMADLPASPSAADTYLLTIPLGDTDPVVVRTTVEVVQVDQTDSASVPGSCDYGLNPQDDCATVVTQLTQEQS